MESQLSVSAPPQPKRENRAPAFPIDLFSRSLSQSLNINHCIITQYDFPKTPGFLRDHDRKEEAEEIIRAGVANVPGNVALHIHLADLLLQRGEFDQAIQEFETVYDLQPDSLVAANNLASMLADFHASNPELVDRAYAIAQRLASSKNPAHMDTYGWILYLRGEYALALRSLKPAAERLRNDPWVQYHTGMVYLKMNQLDPARLHLQAALDAGGSRMFPLREQAQAALDEIKSQ